MPYCPNCGVRIGRTAHFCKECGFDLKEAEKAKPEVSSYTTKCAIHPERDAVGTCVDCGRGVCVLCRTVAGDKLYCPSCIDKILSRPVERTGTSKKPKKPIKRAGTSRQEALMVDTSGQEPLAVVKRLAMARRLAAVKPFASGHARALLVVVFLAIFIVVCLFSVAADIEAISLTSRGAEGAYISYSEAAAVDDHIAIASSLQFLAFIITAVFFCIWIYRAHKNLLSLNSHNLKYTPGWAVGWFFIPIFSLFRPYQVTREIWKASDPRTDITNGTTWRNAPGSPLLGWWWALWIIASFGGYIVSRLYWYAEDWDSLLGASYAYLGYDILSIIPSILAVMVILNIDRRQKEKYESLTAYQSQQIGKSVVFGKDAVPDLVEALKDEDWRVREVAAETLGKIGTHAKSAVPVLSNVMKDKNEDSDVRKKAAEALKKISG